MTVSREDVEVSHVFHDSLSLLMQIFVNSGFRKPPSRCHTTSKSPLPLQFLCIYLDTARSAPDNTRRTVVEGYLEAFSNSSTRIHDVPPSDRRAARARHYTAANPDR